MLNFKVENKGIYIILWGWLCQWIGRYVARELAKELEGRSREFYEFVVLAIDMKEGGDDLVVTIDLPGFAKKDITISGLSAMSCP